MKTVLQILFAAITVHYLLPSPPCLAQVSSSDSRVDSIRASRIISERTLIRSLGTRMIPAESVRTTVAAVGGGDAIKYIQTLPGISTGAEGSSAYYARGGNLGGNLMTIDDVPVYGSSHMLGLSSVYPSEVISDITFRIGGFSSDESNVTSSHVLLQTRDGDMERASSSLSVGSSYLSGSVSAPIVKDKVSFIGSIRFSPLAPIFNIAKSSFGGLLGDLSDVRMRAYDAFAKATYDMDGNNVLRFELFHSADAYRFAYKDISHDRLAWGNTLAILSHDAVMWEDWKVSSKLSFNRFANDQGVVKDMSGTENNLAVRSSLNELTLQGKGVKKMSERGSIQVGFISRLASFNPGTSAVYSGSGFSRPKSIYTGNRYYGLLDTFHFQWENEGGHHYLKMATKMNLFLHNCDGDGRPHLLLNPEGSLSWGLTFGPFSFAATCDYATQYYHTLEGVPLGWSVDMIIPSESGIRPEHALQGYGGFSLDFDRHYFSAGVYVKKMWNLTYFADASKLFSSAVAGWKTNIDIGEGFSKGLEILYEKTGDRVNGKVAYTFSKSDRQFENVNYGEVFPAKFDRRHILNANISVAFAKSETKEWGMTGFFTYQSGHWETVPAGEFYFDLPFSDQRVEIDYYTKVNNYRMPPYRRIDVGFYLRTEKKHVQTFNVGVYNLLNIHNPFMITYDQQEKQWKQISLLPIMPSFSYSIEF
ncbi:MAG: hypothetical protein IKS22_04185 [Bacteroidales bacterium]|nr:hypothetical protein [Bacteroidales bacterium]